MAAITQDNKQIAKKLHKSLGESTPKVQQYNHDNKEIDIDILYIC